MDVNMPAGMRDKNLPGPGPTWTQEATALVLILAGGVSEPAEARTRAARKSPRPISAAD